MRPSTPDDPLDGPVFPPDAVIRSAVHAAVETDKPLRIVAGDTLVGVVDRAHILAAIAGNDPEPVAAVASADRPATA
jgi:glycine betaine/proline transport system ATP-binding protein